MKKFILSSSVILMLSGVVFLGAINHANTTNPADEKALVERQREQMLALMNQPQALRQVIEVMSQNKEFQNMQLQIAMQNMMLKNFENSTKMTEKMTEIIEKMGKKKDDKKDDKPFYQAWKDSAVDGAKDGALWMFKKVPENIFWYSSRGLFIYLMARLITRSLPGGVWIDGRIQDATVVAMQTLYAFFNYKGKGNYEPVIIPDISCGPQLPQPGWFDIAYWS